MNALSHQPYPPHHPSNGQPKAQLAFLIGFDAKRAVYNHTGLGNYSRFVVEGLAEALHTFGGDPTAETLPWHADAPRAGAEESTTANSNKATAGAIGLVAAEYRHRQPNATYRELLARYPGLIRTIKPRHFLSQRFPALWRRYGMSRTLVRNGIRLFHGLSGELPVGLKRHGIRSIVTVHDLIFLRYPQFYKPIDVFFYKLKARHACRKADRILAVSECTKRDIVRFFNIPPDKIQVIYQGCEPRFAENPGPSVLTAVRRRYGLPENFLLFVGSIEARKNLLVAVKALELLRDDCPDLHLVAVGKRTPYTAQTEAYAAAHGLSGRLHCLHGLPNDDLRALYHAARLFVYPSLYEGFGIPIIEAIQAGLPVIAATGSCLEEAGGPAGLYIAPDDAPAWAEAIRRLLADAETCRHIVRESQSYVQRFDQKAVTWQLLQLYRELSPAPQPGV